MNSQEMARFADQLIGKTVQEQAAAGNAEGCHVSAEPGARVRFKDPELLASRYGYCVCVCVF